MVLKKLIFLFIFIACMQYVFADTNINTCQNLTIANSTYFLTSNISSPIGCIFVFADNITIDCQGYTINYSYGGVVAGYGISSAKNYTNIKNCIINEGITLPVSKYAINFLGVNNGLIYNNTINTLGTTAYGAYLSTRSSGNNISNNNFNMAGPFSNGIMMFSNSSNNKITNNNIATVQNFAYGIRSDTNSDSNIITNNTIRTSGPYTYGIFLYLSTKNILSNNNVTTSQTSSYAIQGTTIAHHNHSIDSTNLAENLPVNYTFNTNNLVFDNVDFTPYGEVMFGYCKNITISNSNFSSDGLNLFNSSKMNITNNIINTTNGVGMLFLSSANLNNITDNIINTWGAGGIGIRMEASTNTNTFINNTVRTNGSSAHGISLTTSVNLNRFAYNEIDTYGSSSYGFRMESSTTSNIIENNNINTYGIAATGAHGVTIESSSMSAIIRNNNISTLANNAHGIFMFSGPAQNIITNNIITTNGSGSNAIHLFSSISTNIISNNILRTFGGGAYGFQLQNRAGHNTFSNNSIVTTGLLSHGVYMTTIITNNTFSLMDINISNTGSAYYIVDSNTNISVSNSIITTNKTNSEIFIATAVINGIWNFTNVTRFDGTGLNVTWQTTSRGNLFVNYLLDVNVTYSSTPISGANVSVKSANDTLLYSDLTDANGLAPTKILASYIGYNRTNYTFYSPYNVNVTKSGYLDYINTTINLSTNTMLNVFLTSSCTPTLVNTSLIFNETIACMPSDFRNDSYYWIEYDSNYCGLIQNQTFTTYLYNASCTCVNLTNTTLIFNQTISCLPNNTKNDSYYWIEYDTNFCGTFANLTYTTNLFNDTCVYCAENVTNTTLIFNQTIACLPNNTRNDSYYWIEYDDNYCGFYVNQTFTTNLFNESCVFCTPNLVNTSLIFNQTIECMQNGYRNDSYYQIQYDSNYCPYAVNQTFTTYIYNVTCTPSVYKKVVFRNYQSTSTSNLFCYVFYDGGPELCMNNLMFSNMIYNSNYNLSDYYTKTEINVIIANLNITGGGGLPGNGTVIEVVTCDGTCTTIIETEYY